MKVWMCLLLSLLVVGMFSTFFAWFYLNTTVPPVRDASRGKILYRLCSDHAMYIASVFTNQGITFFPE